MSTYRRSAMAAVAALILAHVVLLIVSYGTSAASRWGDWIGSAASLAAALASWDAARRSASFGKRVWRLVSLSLVLATLGQIVYTYYFDYLPDSATSAGMWPSDVLVFFWAVPAMMTLFLSPRDPHSGFRWLRLCDFVQVCTLVLALELSLLYVPSRWLSSAQTMDFRVFHAALIFFGLLALSFLVRGLGTPLLLSRLALLVQHFIQRIRQQMCPLLVIGSPALLLPLQKMILIRNVQRRQHRQPHRIDRIGSLGHGAHLGVHILRQLQNVFGIRPSQVVALIEDLHPHASVLRFLQCRFLISRNHNQSIQQLCELAIEPAETLGLQSPNHSIAP
jgi:hypothetical protein